MQISKLFLLKLKPKTGGENFVFYNTSNILRISVISAKTDE